MDDLQAHKNPNVLARIRSVGATTLFLPPYSPEWNPIERVWSKMKAQIRRMETLTRETFDDAVAYAMNQISQSNLLSWIRHAGYTLANT
ncbi:MAG: transposase [Myxococcota bacterium]